MEPLHAVMLTVSLFVLTFFNPGANPVSYTHLTLPTNSLV